MRKQLSKLLHGALFSGLSSQECDRPLTPNYSITILRNDEGNDHDNATYQRFDSLNEKTNRAARAARFLVQF